MGKYQSTVTKCENTSCPVVADNARCQTLPREKLSEAQLHILVSSMASNAATTFKQYLKPTTMMFIVLAI